MAAGKISIQANDGKVAGVVFEDGASNNVTVTVPKEGGTLATQTGLSTKQDTLVSGTSIKTINSTSLLGSGNISIVSPAASQTVAGLVEIATNEEVQAGTDTVRAVTPAGLLSTFVNSKTANGYTKLPNGLIIQWGTTSAVSLSSSLTVTLPITFPTACLNVVSTRNGAYVSGVTESAWSVEIVSTSQIKIEKGTNSGGTGTATPFFYLAIGY